MKEFIISKNETGRRLDQYLFRLLPGARPSLIYKQIRDKNITVNKKKAAHDRRLDEGDAIQIFFSDETFDRLSAPQNEKVPGNREIFPVKNEKSSEKNSKPSEKTVKAFDKIKIIYEDEDFIFVDKPAGVLSQTDRSSIASINEWLIQYLLDSGQISKKELATFKPAFCNRLDRNTTGIMLGGKSLRGLRVLSEMLRDRSLEKYYKARVWGLPDMKLPVKKDCFIDLYAYLVKDNRNNTVKIYDSYEAAPKGAAEIHTGCRLIESYKDRMLVEIDLHTGKTHQIRAHMAFLGHPLVGDPKYGSRVKNSSQAADNAFQDLRAYRVVFPKLEEFPNISGREFVI